ncbi:hypothetical protein ACPPVT_21855 [Angustibacter sp. McL0619]
MSNNHQPQNEREHQRDAGAALLLGALVVAVLMLGYMYLHN